MTKVLERRLFRVPPSTSPFFSDPSIFTSSAEKKMSDGAPSSICRARKLDAPKLNRTAVFTKMNAKKVIGELLEAKEPSIVAVVATCATGRHAETIRNARGTPRGYIEDHVAYNERGARLGEYRDGKTYVAPGGQLFGYGQLLSALIVKDAQRRGVWS